MTDRLYYHDPFFYDFEAEVREQTDTPRPALIFDRTAFYPTSGGQVHDTGWILAADQKFRVTEVADTEDGRIIHYLEAPVKDLKPGTRIRGQIDPTRRRDHMQQHSGQHVLSAAFVRLFNMPTVSFHMATIIAPSISTRPTSAKTRSNPPSASPTKSSSRTVPSTSVSSCATRQRSLACARFLRPSATNFASSTSMIST